MHIFVLLLRRKTHLTEIYHENLFDTPRRVIALILEPLSKS